MSENRILVVDDEPGVRSVLRGILRDEGFEVTTAASGEEALEVIESEPYDAVLLDIWLPGIDGLETLNRLRERSVDSEVVMISGHGTIETAVRATKLGAFDFVEKPLSLERTLLVLRNALRKRDLERRNRVLLAQLARGNEIVGQSPAAERLRADVVVAAGADSRVLVLGERGSGRQAVIRGVYVASRRADEAFVEVPCAALDAAAASEALFGVEGRPGRLELARNGSLFLKDVDVLAAKVQKRLAAHLETEEFLGLDCRVMASAQRGSKGLGDVLRERLEVVTIEVPPLRERREDIPLIAERFITELAREYGRPDKRISRECLQALKAYDWPGNLRELQNLLERLLLTVSGPTIERSDLPPSLGGGEEIAVDLYGEFPSLEAGLEAFEKHYVRRALAAHDGDVSKTAKKLGLRVGQLRERMRALQV